MGGRLLGTRLAPVRPCISVPSLLQKESIRFGELARGRVENVGFWHGALWMGGSKVQQCCHPDLLLVLCTFAVALSC